MVAEIGPALLPQDGIRPENVIRRRKPSWAAIGDLDGDLHLDLAVTNHNSDIVSVLLNDCPSPPCPVDLDDSRVVDTADLVAPFAAWGPCEQVVLSPSIPVRSIHLPLDFQEGARYAHDRKARRWSRATVKSEMSDERAGQAQGGRGPCSAGPDAGRPGPAGKAASLIVERRAIEYHKGGLMGVAS